ncbi:kinectin [Rosa chinensis]|uniref:kinectin n=1 Tax=Rosa chinensis TaxID=74649 RepID=UPI000D08E76D|nr:kinectin [Rosa chinensis]
METAAAELEQKSEAKQRSLGAAFESLSSQASSILKFTVEWKELEDHFESTRRVLRTRFEEVRDRVKEVAEMEAKEERLKMEVKGREKELREIEEVVERRRREVEESESYLESVRALIVENDEELRVREERYDKVERLIREKEREVEEMEKHVRERSRKLSWLDKRIEVKKKEVERKERELREVRDLEEKKLSGVRGLIEEKRKEVELKEDEMVMVKGRVEDCDREMKEKEERLSLIEKSKGEMIGVVDLKGKEFCLLKKSMEEWCCKIEVKERELEGWVDKLESKEKEVELKVEELDLIRSKFLDELQFKENHLDSLEKSLLEWEEDLHSLQKSVQECSRGSEIIRNGRGLQQFMDEHLKRIDSMGTELSAILKDSSDPGKLVLDAMQGFYADNRELDFELRVRRRSCCLLLEELRRISPQMNPQVKEEATKLAANWKAKMTVASDNDLEVLGFLWLVAAYDLTSIYDAKELKRLLSKVSRGEQAAQIGLALGIPAPGSRNICSPVKIEEPESSTANNAATISSPNPQTSATTDARDSRGCINETLNWNVDTIQNEIVASVQSASDPEELVLKMMQNSLGKYWTSTEDGLKRHVMSCNISLLKMLMRVSPQVGSHVKEDAKKLGLQWKAKIRADAEHLEHLLEIVGFLLFIVAYGLLPTLNGDEIVKFLEKLSQYKEAVESCQMHGFLDKILAVFIQTLVERKQLFQALGFVFKFKLRDKFTPVRVLKDYVKDAMKCWSETLKRKKSVDEKVEFLDSKIAAFGTVLRCIKEYNLESEYPSREIAVQIGELEKLKEIWRSSAKHLASVTRQQESQGKKRSSSTCSPAVQQGQQQKSKFHRTAEAAPSPYKSPTFTPVLLQSRPSSSLAYGNDGQHGQVGDMAANSSEVDRSSSLAYGNYGQLGQFGDMAANSSEVDRSSSLVSEIHGQHGQFGYMAANLAEVNPRFGTIDEVDPHFGVHNLPNPYSSMDFTFFPGRYGPY